MGLYQELDRIILALIAHPETKYDEDASLKAIHDLLIRLANTKNEQYGTEVSEPQTAQPMAQPTPQPLQGLSLAQRITRGYERIGGQN